METSKLPLRPVVSSYWEPLLLPNGDLFFNNIYGKHIRLKNHTEVIHDMVKLCDGKKTVEEIRNMLVEKGYQFSLDAVRGLIGKLSAKGILVENVEADLPDWLTPAEYERFHTLIAWFDRFKWSREASLQYFKKIREAKVAVIGLGGTGSLLAMMLASTGCRHIRLIDGDEVDISNLVRQIFFDESSVGTSKVDAMERRLKDFYSDIQVETFPQYINSVEDAKKFIDGMDFVFLQADAPRFVLNRWINQACVDLRIPYVYSFAGLIAPAFVPGESACFVCLEQHMSKFYLQDHESIVQSLQQQRTRKYPSVVLGITANSHYQFHDALGIITGAYEPISKNAIIHLREGDAPVQLERIKREHLCPVCGADA